MHTEQLIRELVKWMQARLKEARAKGFVVGMSGGIDSAVAAVLAHRAAPDSTLGMIMPCGSDPQDRILAEEVARTFRIRTAVVDLTHAFSVIHQELHAVLAEEFRLKSQELKVPAGNLKPRLRMTTMYFFANALSSLVVGTGNRSELVMGYFTKHGDGGADLLPLGGLLKTEVRTLAQSLGIPRAVIERPPTAGLWEGQTDEGEMGITYETLDKAIHALWGPKLRGPHAAVSRADQAKVRNIFDHTQHKRLPIPVFRPGGASR